MIVHWVKCVGCGTTDRTDDRHTGTAIEMLCVDCGAAHGGRKYATMCRKCCPTGHGTHGDMVEENLLLNLAANLVAWERLAEDCHDRKATPGTMRAVFDQIASARQAIMLAKKVIARVER